jgi:hypothetical protein
MQPAVQDILQSIGNQKTSLQTWSYVLVRTECEKMQLFRGDWNDTGQSYFPTNSWPNSSNRQAVQDKIFNAMAEEIYA